MIFDFFPWKIEVVNSKLDENRCVFTNFSQNKFNYFS